MNTQTPGVPRSRVTIVFHLILWTWLIGLSVAMLVNFSMTPRLAQQDQLVSVQRQQQVLEGRLGTLDEAIQTLRAQPPAAKADALQETREALETRLALLEQAISTQATATDLAALRTEIEQLKARQTAMQISAAARPRTTQPTAVPPKEQPPSFRVMGLELRAGQPSVSVAPAAASSLPPSADQIQPVLVGEAVGEWRLEAIDGQTAVFRSDEQTRRLAIP